MARPAPGSGRRRERDTRPSAEAECRGAHVFRASDGSGAEGGAECRAADAGAADPGTADAAAADTGTTDARAAAPRAIDLDAALAALADRQHGVVSQGQLRDLGLSRMAIDRRRRRKLLRPLHRGVYAVGHLAVGDAARRLAAVLACGPGAVLSHGSAAGAWAMLRGAGMNPVHVTVPARNCGQKAGIRVHRVNVLDVGEVTQRHGIPITSPARTILDLATSGAAERTLERAIDEACIQRLLTLETIETALAAHPGRRGAARLRALLELPGASAVTRSQAEETLLELIRRAGLPRPIAGAQLGAFTVDFYWPSHRVAVEVDGYRFHSTRGAFERDHEKDLELRSRGIALLRFTWRRLSQRPEATLVQIVTALARRAPA